MLMVRLALSMAMPAALSPAPPGAVAAVIKITIVTMRRMMRVPCRLLLTNAHHRGPLADVRPFQVAGGDVQAPLLDDRAAVDHAGRLHLGVRSQIELPLLGAG